MRAIILLAATFAVIGCGNDQTISSPAPVSVIGSYALASVDGAPLPFVALEVGAYKLSLTSGSLHLKPDSSYLITYGLRVDDSGNVRFDADSDSGRWSANARALSMSSTEGNIAKSGTAFGDSIVLQSSTVVLVFKR